MPVEPRAPIDAAILAQAAEWFALLGSESASEADRRAWEGWLAACPEHRAAWARVEAVTRKLDRLPARAASAALGAVDPGRRRALKTLAMLCGVGIAGFGAWRAAPWREWLALHQTGVGTTRKLILPDSTRVWLNTGSALDVAFAADLRCIRLHAGEALIETAPDRAVSARPFVVDSAECRVRALGTRFCVRRSEWGSQVAVYRGAIEIQPAAAARRTLHAGQETRFTRDTIAAPQPANEEATAWTRGLLLADNMRLGDFVAELARYRRGYLGCAPEVAELRIVGAFPLADTDRVLAALERALPVRVATLGPFWVSIEASPRD